MSQDLAPQRTHPAHTWSFCDDGIFELLLGLALAAEGALLLPRWINPLLAAAPPLAVSLLLPLGKRFITWPRVAPRRVESQGSWVALLLSLAALALGTVGFVRVWLGQGPALVEAVYEVMRVAVQALPFCLGLVVGLALILSGYLAYRWRLALQGMLWVVFGALIDAFFPLGGEGAAILCIGLGATMALLGLIILVRFVRRAPHI